MDRFQAIAAFVKVVETGSFARAAERLDASVSSISRQIAELEAHLDARLLNRTTRRLSLTESGRVFHERCVQLLADLEEAEQSANAGTAKPHGTLRLTCAITFGARHLAPAIAAFLAIYPDMRFDVELSDRAVDLVDEGFDVAVRIGDIGSQNLVGRKIGVTRLVCCAAPSYLQRNGEPRTPEDLAAHVCLTYEYSTLRNVWRFLDRQGGEHHARIAGPIHANNGRFLEALAVEGVGIAFEPDFIVGPDIRAGRLVRLLRGYQPSPTNIYIVYPSRRHLSAKVRVFAEFLIQRFATPGWALDEESHSTTPRSRKASITATGSSRRHSSSARHPEE
jgi:DNA-binding transcriptional LysR family regulator